MMQPGNNESDLPRDDSYVLYGLVPLSPLIFVTKRAELWTYSKQVEHTTLVVPSI